MSKNNSSSSKDGLGILGVLQIVFIVLKVFDIIQWSWWLVLIPTWISVGLLLLIILIALFINLFM